MQPSLFLQFRLPKEFRCQVKNDELKMISINTNSSVPGYIGARRDA